MEILSEVKHVYSAFICKRGGILTFLSGGPGVYATSIKLTDDDIARIRHDPSYAEKLSQEAMMNSARFLDRQIKPSLLPCEVPENER